MPARIEPDESGIAGVSKRARRRRRQKAQDRQRSRTPSRAELGCDRKRAIDPTRSGTRAATSRSA